MLEELKKMLEEHKKSLLETWTADKQEEMNKIAGVEARIALIEEQIRLRMFPLPGLEDEKQKFSLFKSILAIKANDFTEAGFEKEVFDNMRKQRALAGTSGVGGYIVPFLYIPELIELLTAESVVMSMGATQMTGLPGSPVYIPRQSAGSTAYWVAENTAITASDPAFEQITLTPKKVAALVKLSNTLLRLSNPSAEAIVNMDIARSLALAIDYAALRGTGLLGSPTGIASTSNINTVAIGGSGGAITFDLLMDMEYELAVDNALRGKLGFVFHPAIKRSLLKKKVAQYSGQTDGSYVVQPTALLQGPGVEQVFQVWLNYPYKMSTQLPINLTKGGSGAVCTEVYFGNWQELLIGQWAGMEIMASQEASTAFESDQTWIRILQEVDIAVRHPASFCLINDAVYNS